VEGSKVERGKPELEAIRDDENENDGDRSRNDVA
jgi:hypothetical protein